MGQGIDLYTEEVQVTEDKKDYEDVDEGICFSIILLTTGKTSLVINVYSSTKKVLATKTIPVEVRNVTMKLLREDHAKGKQYTLWLKGNTLC